jgi:glycosyltransferase involved in cell wall biosynthesis
MSRARPVGISVVVPLSSPEYLHYLENCLASIDNQSIDRSLFDIMLAYVYNPKNAADGVPMDALVRLAARHDATIVFHEHDYPDFPLALARNVGGRRAARNIVGFIDADLVLDPDTFETVLRLVPSSCKAACVHVYRMGQEPWHPIYKQLDKDVFRVHAKKGSFDAAGKGGCFFIDTALFHNMRGYDERIWGWGAEDDDMWRRLDNARVKMAHLLTDGIVAMHQYHEHRTGYAHRVATNRRLASISPSVVRNEDRWGGLEG